MSIKKWVLSQLSSAAFNRLIIIGVWLALILANYLPDTRNLSWDLMDSSFNPGLNIWRSLFGTWQEFQGLGLLGGHGYAAQLPHALFSWLLGWVFPQDLLRYIFAFVMLLAGALGSFELFRYIFVRDVTHARKRIFLPTVVSLIGSLVYLLHFSTVQTFYVHLEPFIVMYGLLPWVLLTLFQLFHQATPKKWLVFFLLNFALSVIGFIPPIFISYLLFVGIALIVQLLLNRRLQTLKKLFAMVVIILATNAYWLAGVTTFALWQPKNYLSAKLNQISTTEFIAKSQTYGELWNTALAKSFYEDSFDQTRYQADAALEPILLPWIEHFQNPAVWLFGLGLFVLSLIGWGIGLFSFSKDREPVFAISLMGLLALSLVSTGTPLLNWFAQLTKLFPVLAQAFRIPFTKLSMSLSLFYAFGISVSIFYGIKVLNKFFQKIQLFRGFGRLMTVAVSLLFLAGLANYARPSFTGNLLYERSRVQLPEEYLQAQAFFSAPDGREQRVLVLPFLLFSGWDMHRWGYTGSGFWWYGINNPILHRSFDVWSPYNETLYQQFRQAIVNQDAEVFSALLKKYDVGLVLFDDSLYLPNKNPDLAFATETKTLLNSLSAEPVFQQGSLFIYEVNQTEKPLVPIYFPQSIAAIESVAIGPREDMAIIDHGDGYIQSADSNPAASYPFALLLAEKVDEIRFVHDGFFYTTHFSQPISAGRLQLPAIEDGQFVTAATLLWQSGVLNISFVKETLVTDTGLEIALPQLPNQSLSLPLSAAKIAVELGRQQVILAAGKSVTVTFILEPNQNITLRYFSYDNVYVESSQPFVDRANVSSLTIPSSVWQSLLVARELEFHQPISSVTLETIISPLQLEFSETTVANCDLKGRGKISRSYEQSVLRQQADDWAVLCEGIALPYASNLMSYLLQIEGENKTGQGLKFFTTNVESGLVGIEYLLTEQQFGQAFSLLPSDVLHPSELALNLETRSYGQLNENVIKRISVFPYSGDRLKKVVITPAGWSDRQIEAAVRKWRKYGTFAYRATVKVSQDNSALVLSQAYDQGWLLLGKGAEHVLYNGWANAWLLPPGEYQVILLYWPQLLTFLGYGLLIVTFIWLLKKRI